MDNRNAFERTKDEQKRLISYSVSRLLGLCIAFQVEIKILKKKIKNWHFCIVQAIIPQFFPPFEVTSLQVQ